MATVEEHSELQPCESLSHQAALDIFEATLSEVIQTDPLLNDLPTQVTLEEVNSQIALEYGQAMAVFVRKGNGDKMPIVVEQKATVLDLKNAIERYVMLKQMREDGIRSVSWRYVWRTYWLCFGQKQDAQKLSEDNKELRDYGIRNKSELEFLKKLKKNNRAYEDKTLTLGYLPPNYDK